MCSFFSTGITLSDGVVFPVEVFSPDEVSCIDEVTFPDEVSCIDDVSFLDEVSCSDEEPFPKEVSCPGEVAFPEDVSRLEILVKLADAVVNRGMDDKVRYIASQAEMPPFCSRDFSSSGTSH